MSDEDWGASALSVREGLRDAIAGGSEPGWRTAVATVTAVEESAYRRPGAKRLVGGDARGGPLAALAERAADGPVRETFDRTADDTEWGLGQNGVIDVLVEPADQSFRPALERVAEGERVAVLTVVGGDHPDAEVGARAVVGEEGSVETTEARPSIPDGLLGAVRERAGEFAVTGRSATVEIETERGTADVFADGLEPVPELLVFGHGEDVRPVVRLAREAGFRVTVAVEDGARADPDEFPSAHEVVAVRPAEVAEVVSRPADTYPVLMSHDFMADRQALAALLETDVTYVGLMGPRKRFEAMRDELAEVDGELADEDAERIATPVGLDLGAGEPSQIALSVVAEVLAVSNERDGGRLTDGEGPIHPRPE
ncbi:XdhC family protein [Halorussus lipolyticus]|uniref:XdhC family protein n=1 Tax=Halorussus lipolyticus TaxID=3034024 RepID=UPI0023E84058|nr:XdhC/CoxI family protein [Halorussus sp. DT80]